MVSTLKCGFVDCIIFGFEEDKLKPLIGKRQMDPGRGEWSLYGGSVGAEESLRMQPTECFSISLV